MNSVALRCVLRPWALRSLMRSAPVLQGRPSGLWKAFSTSLQQPPSPSQQPAKEMSSTIASAAAVTPAVPRSKREYPAHPLVGVGVVVFRSLQSPHEVLVVRRAKEPSKGMWSFPGGGLELGETIRQCAVREVLEETGVAMRNGSEGADSVEAFSAALAFPTAFAALDLITPDTAGRILYQYAIIEVAGVAEDPDVPLVASDDVDAAMWVAVDQLRQLDNLTTSCARFAEEAQARFCSGGGTPTQAPGRGQ